MTEFNREIRNRIRLSVAAYAYEFENDPVMTDQEFDELALVINPNIETGNEILDEFFRTEFVSFSGIWVHSHPDKPGLKRIYDMLKKTEDFDLKYNDDIFKPIVKPVKVQVDPQNICRRCRKDFMRSPFDGGCHC